VGTVPSKLEGEHVRFIEILSFVTVGIVGTALKGNLINLAKVKNLTKKGKGSAKHNEYLQMKLIRNT
jgi:hypothetical protein